MCTNVCTNEAAGSAKANGWSIDEGAGGTIDISWEWVWFVLSGRVTCGTRGLLY